MTSWWMSTTVAATSPQRYSRRCAPPEKTRTPHLRRPVPDRPTPRPGRTGDAATRAPRQHYFRDAGARRRRRSAADWADRRAPLRANSAARWRCPMSPRSSAEPEKYSPPRRAWTTACPSDTAARSRLPYPNATFDVGWTQHSSMNIPVKRAALRGDTARAKPWRTPGVARDPGRTALPHPPPGAVGAGTCPQPLASPRANSHPPQRHRF